MLRSRCPHAEAVQPVPQPGKGCEICLETGDRWVHLRQCLTCGRTLCCNDSPNQHMLKHAKATGHPIMRSVEPGEHWAYCFADDAMVRETPGGWETYDSDVEIGVHLFRRRLAHGGSVDVEPDEVTEGGFPIGAWSEYVRSLRASGELDPADAADIEALAGWRW